MRYFVIWSLFANVKKSKTVMLATYIGHNDAVRLTFARAIEKRGQWSIKTLSLRASVAARMRICVPKKRREPNDTKSRKKRNFSSLFFTCDDVSSMGVYFCEKKMCIF